MSFSPGTLDVAGEYGILPGPRRRWRGWGLESSGNMDLFLYMSVAFVGMVAGWIIFGRLDRELAKRLRADFDELQKRSDARVVELEDKVAALEQRLATAHEQLEGRGVSDERTATDVRRLREEIEELEEQHTEQHRALAQQSAERERLTGELAEATALLAQAEERASVRATDCEQLERARQAQEVELAQLRNQGAELDALRKRMAAQEAELEALRADRHSSEQTQDTLIERLRAELAQEREAQVAARGECQQWSARCAGLESELAAARADSSQLEEEGLRQLEELEEKEEQISRFREHLASLMRERAVAPVAGNSAGTTDANGTSVPAAELDEGPVHATRRNPASEAGAAEVAGRGRARRPMRVRDDQLDLDLAGADGADPSDADPSGADPSDADPSDADPSGAASRGAHSTDAHSIDAEPIDARWIDARSIDARSIGDDPDHADSIVDESDDDESEFGGSITHRSVARDKIDEAHGAGAAEDLGEGVVTGDREAVTAGEAEASSGDAAPDDLVQLSGIGPSLARRLNELGLRTFHQIAHLDERGFERLCKVLPPFRNEGKRSALIESARRLLREKHGKASRRT